MLSYGIHSPTRRELLRVGALGGLSLATLLRAEAATRAADTGAGRPAKRRARSVIVVFLGGGLSHHDTFDPKPDAPAEIRGDYKPIPTSVPGLLVSEKLPKLAGVMDKVTLVRSGSHNNDHHETATNWVLSGRFGSPFGDYPAIGAVAAKHFGFEGKVPQYVAVPSNPSFTWELGKSAFLGGRYESFAAGDPNLEGYRVKDLSGRGSGSAERQARRAELLQTVDQLARRVEGNDQVATYDEFQRHATQMVLSSDARKAFAIEVDAPKVRDRYGRTRAGQSMLMARRLVEAGVRFVTVNYGGWDHHAKVFPSLNRMLPELDQGLSALITDLHERGTAADTLLAVFGEFGRGPKLNKDAGRDHWGHAASLLFAGAGVNQGFVLGKTDKHGAYVTNRPVTPADVCYTILDSLGIDPRAQIYTPDGRPLEVLDQGELVKEIFGSAG
jgi:hypothetical protein